RCISALGKTFHPEHFFCGQCGRTFDAASGVGFMEYDGKAYCQEDYAALFAKTCAGCSKALLDNYMIACGAMWHTGCFKCQDCGKPFDINNGFFEHEGKALCEKDYYARRSTLCATCNQPIIGKCISALGKRYHEDHFLCTFCKKVLEAGSNATSSSSSNVPMG
ncbi:hypothetical protein HK102_012416, partial [Quaeritorhiza haematococci]